MATSSTQLKKAHSGRRSASVNFLESIARSLRPLLRRVSKEQGAYCARDPLGGPGWLLHLHDHHLCEVRVVSQLCEVQVVSQPNLHLEVIGYWFDPVKLRMVRLTPFVIALDQNGKEVLPGSLYLHMFIMFGRLFGISRRARQAAADS